MRDILPDLMKWQERQGSIALATVVQTWGSSPRQVGAKMALMPNGHVTGSVSGGCVENAVVEAGLSSLKTNTPQLLHFGVADETAWDVGLACGGSIDIFVQPLNLHFQESLIKVLQQKQQAVVFTLIQGPTSQLGQQVLVLSNNQTIGLAGNPWEEQVFHLYDQVIRTHQSQRIKINNEIEIFAELINPPNHLVAVGGTHITIELLNFAKTLGYETTLIDPRQFWGNEQRFPHVDEIIQAWPEAAFQQINITPATAIAMLTHDPKLDDPALKIALNSSAFYIGALGSKSTNAKRRERLLQYGLTEDQLSRLHAPIGLSIGAKSPEEIALSIMAQIVEADRKRNPAASEKAPVVHP